MANPITAQWSELGAAGRATAVVGVAAVLALFVLGAWWVLRDDYQVLFTDLDPRDGAAIVAELDKAKVRYRLADGGTTVLVPAEDVHKTRLKVMGKGLDLKGTVGFEIFNNSDFGMTEFAQRINYQRALQGELARTIMAIEEVKHARVHLVMPESGLFRKQTAKPKASVALVTRTDARLRPEQIAGIQRLVAAAVPELDPASVTVLDQQGVALSRPAEADSDAGVAATRLELKKQTEAYFVKKVAEVLDGAFGPGQAIVSVDVTLNADHVKVTREDVLQVPRRDGELVGAVTRRRQQVPGPVGGADGSTQASANVAGRAEPRFVGSGTATYEVEYENGRRVEQIVSQPGTIRRLSVGVLVPANVEPAKIQRLTEVVGMAVGLNAERGDAIAVYSLDQMLAARNGSQASGLPPGATNLVVPEAAPAEPRPRTDAPRGVPRELPWVLLGVAILLVAGLALVRRARSRRADGAAKLSEAEREAALAEIKTWLGSEPASAGNKG